jgi:hypothetical protein
MNNQQKINKLENKITEIQSMLSNYKSEITKYESTLLGLIQQVVELKSLENNQKNIK